MERLAGFALIAGSLLFIIAAFMPITFKVITASDPQQRVEYIQNNRRGWLLVNILFGAGSVISVVGLWLLVQHVQSVGDISSVALMSYLGSATAALGSVFWIIIVYKRASLPPQALAGNLSVNRWMFPVYTVLMQIALMIVGFVLAQSGYPAWLGWGTFALGGLSLIAFLVFKDMPPFAHYVLLLVIGIVLVL